MDARLVPNRLRMDGNRKCVVNAELHTYLMIWMPGRFRRDLSNYLFQKKVVGIAGIAEDVRSIRYIYGQAGNRSFTREHEQAVVARRPSNGFV